FPRLIYLQNGIETKIYMKKTGILSFVLFWLAGYALAQENKPADICAQLNQVVNSSIHRFAEIKTSDQESGITLDGFPQNGFIDLTSKNTVQWGSRDLIFKKK